MYIVTLLSLVLLATAQTPNLHGEFSIKFSTPTSQVIVSIYWDPGNNRYRVDLEEPTFNETIWRRFDTDEYALAFTSGSQSECCQMDVFGESSYEAWRPKAKTENIACGTNQAVQFYTGYFHDSLALFAFQNVELGFTGSELVCIRYKSLQVDVTYPISFVAGQPDANLFEINFPITCTCQQQMMRPRSVMRWY